MSAEPAQLDLMRDSQATRAAQCRAAAETALVDWNWSPEKQRERHRYFMAMAEAIERGEK
jgi:hypothetical protein